MRNMKRAVACHFFAAVVSIGLSVPVRSAHAGTYDAQWFVANGISVVVSPNQGWVQVDLTGNATDGQCILVRSWYQGTPTIRYIFQDAETSTVLAHSAYETHTLDIIVCSTGDVLHTLVIPAGDQQLGYWAT